MEGELSFVSFACFSANYSIKVWLALLLQSFSVRHDFGLFNNACISESNVHKSWPIQTLSSYKTGFRPLGGHVKYESRH